MGRITILNDSRTEGFIEALTPEGKKCLQRVSQIAGFVPDPGLSLEVIVRVLELALHSRKERLQDALVKEACVIGPHVDALFLGYGLCGNALENPEALFEAVGVPVFLPMDEDHAVDDCVGLIIGGRKRYYEEQCRVAGTFFMTPGWSRHWKAMLEKGFGSVSLPILKRMLADYRRTLLVLNPVLSQDEMIRNTEEFNRLFGLYTKTCEGSLNILFDAWERAKSFLKSQLMFESWRSPP